MTTQTHLVASPPSRTSGDTEDLLYAIRHNHPSAELMLHNMYGEGIAFLLRHESHDGHLEELVPNVILDVIHVIRQRQPLTFREVASFVVECTRKHSTHVKIPRRGLNSGVPLNEKLRSTLHQAVQNLPAGEREVLLRTYVQLQQDATIAAATHLSIDAIHAVRSKCRHLFQTLAAQSNALRSKRPAIRIN